MIINGPRRRQQEFAANFARLSNLQSKYVANNLIVKPLEDLLALLPQLLSSALAGSYKIPIRMDSASQFARARTCRWVENMR